MILTLSLVLLVQNPPILPGPPRPVVPANALALPNNVFEYWPGPERSAYRWTMNPPLGKRPFMVASMSNEGQIAVRWATSGPRELHYVAMRQTAERLEEADSRECAFGDLIRDLRHLQMPEPRIWGTAPEQNGPYPQFTHRAAALYFSDGIQSDQMPADISISSGHGPIWSWTQSLFAATRECWKPMTPPEPLPPRPSD